MPREKFYSLDNIKSKKAIYNMIFGERSNGKTYSVLEEILKIHIESNYVQQGAIFRRWDEDFKGKNGEQQFDGFINNIKGNQIQKLTKGKYNTIVWQSRRWYLANTTIDEDGKMTKVVAEYPFCFAFALTNDEHYKSLSYPQITTILFDEFITRKYYLPNEFITFQSLLSTIIRGRDNVIIYMCGNTINKYTPYFKEMGLNHVQQMKKGDIDVYDYGESGLRVAVEYADSPSKKGKSSDKYFAFDNPKLKMITHGEWEIDVYPHLPFKYSPKDVIYNYFIVFENNTLHCKIIEKDDELITYIHQKTTPIKDDGVSLIYQQDYTSKVNHRRKITKPMTQLEKKILSFFYNDKVFYQDNEIGEIVRNYLQWCKSSQ